MRSKQPTLEQRRHLMNMRQQMFVCRLLALHLTDMGVSRQIAIRNSTKTTTSFYHEGHEGTRRFFKISFVVLRDLRGD